tara:strand:+ start:7091 stop:7276 length:186 start_codon:yes stop_codon:yes gene_type:complete
MQLRLKPKFDRSEAIRKLTIKIILFVAIIFLAIFLLDKIEIKAPIKHIKQKISNDKLITIK